MIDEVEWRKKKRKGAQWLWLEAEHGALDFSAVAESARARHH